MTHLIPETYTAPAAWASYFINGDDSGLEAQDVAAADAWAATLPGPIVGLEEGESFFIRWHDAAAHALAADCVAYVVHRQGTAEEAEERAAQVALEAAQAAEAAADLVEGQAQADLESAGDLVQAEADALEAAQGEEERQEAGQALADAVEAHKAAQERHGRAMAERAAAERATGQASGRLGMARAAVARQEALAQAVEALAVDMPQDARPQEPGRGWRVLAEYRGRRYLLARAADYATAEGLAESWRAWAAGGRYLLDDTARAAVNGGPVAYLDALEAHRWSVAQEALAETFAGFAPGHRAEEGRNAVCAALEREAALGRPGGQAAAWAVYAARQVGGRWLPVARRWAGPCGAMVARVTAESWADLVAHYFGDGAALRVRLVRLEEEGRPVEVEAVLTTAQRQAAQVGTAEEAGA